MKKLFIVIAVVILIVLGIVATLFAIGPQDPFVETYENNCMSCHGEDLRGIAPHGPALVDVDLAFGESVAELSKNIAYGFPEKGMPAFSEQLTPEEIRSLGIYIAERRVDRLFTDFKVDAPLALPKGTIHSQVQDFRVELVTDKIDPLPFSIQPLPDGRILVSEKMYGLRIVNTDGTVSELIAGTPEVFDDSIELVLVWGHGWLLDIALHPEYEKNGWIYLHHTERCAECIFPPKSFNRVVRGRIHDGQWIDEEEIWDPGPEYYSVVPDIGAGGRLAFDAENYLYISVGVKGSSNYDGVQDLTKPWGKIHRVHDDGRIPKDNPFFYTADAYPTIWTYGHRSPQGLEFNHKTNTVWSTEMGPRGGDELNLLLPGRNYGWPLFSLGLNYDGSAIKYAEWLDIAFDLNDIEQPVVDLTPAPAVSSFVFYQGEQFSAWAGHALVGSLKGSELYRIVLDENDRYVSSEVLLTQLARIRDVEVGPDGNVYLLLEHADGGQIVRLVPDNVSVQNVAEASD